MAAKNERKKRKKTASKGDMVIRSKRKEAVARAHIRSGMGRVRINKIFLSAIANPYAKAIMAEPLEIADEKLINTVDIDINVYGGGAMGQAQAVRSAIARALVAYTNDMGLRQRLYDRDKYLIVEDSRRVEPKKYMGPKARARFQKSFR